jgi:hypothetical protein
MENKHETLVEKIEDIIKDDIKKTGTHLKLGKIIIFFLVAGIMTLILSTISIPMLSALPAIFANCGIGFSAFYIIDRWGLSEVDTIGMIKSSSIAFAGIIIVFGMIILASILAT